MGPADIARRITGCRSSQGTRVQNALSLTWRVRSARPCTRVLPFVVGCPAAPAVDDFEGREDPTMTAARVVHDHIWGAPWPAETDEAATLAAALQWRKARALTFVFQFLRLEDGCERTGVSVGPHSATMRKACTRQLRHLI